MKTWTIQIGGGEYTFCAAHTGLHAGRFEPLHGHTFVVTLRLTGHCDRAGMIADFSAVKTALRQAITPLRRRTLLAAHADQTTIMTGTGYVRVSDGVRRYELPESDVVLLPVVNTTTEQLAGYLLDHIRSSLPLEGAVTSAELELAEAADVAAIARVDLDTAS